MSAIILPEHAVDVASGDVGYQGAAGALSLQTLCIGWLAAKTQRNTDAVASGMRPFPDQSVEIKLLSVI